MKKLIYLKYDSISLALLSIAYGLALIIHPHLMQNHHIYDLVASILNHNVYGFLFLLAGVLKISGIVFDWSKVRLVALISLIGLWTLFLVGFLLSGQFSTIWLFVAYVVLNAFWIAKKERF